MEQQKKLTSGGDCVCRESLHYKKPGVIQSKHTYCACSVASHGNVNLEQLAMCANGLDIFAVANKKSVGLLICVCE